jgi:hypothetical protein
MDPCNFDLLYALFSFYMKKENRVKAAPYVQKLKTCFPNEKQVDDLYNNFFNRR